MVIDKAGFLMMAGTLAAGGIGGWLVHDSKAHPERVQESESVREAPAPTASASAAPAVAPVVSVAATPPPPLCDDSVGSPGDCPAVGPADEGVCNNSFAAKRCAEYKAAFKPRVAQAAVACLKALKGGEACDPARVNLCGHAALMAACPESTPLPSVNAVGASAPAGAAPNAAEPSSPVVQTCDAILKSCASAPIPPTSADCRQTASGMTDLGRSNLIACMASHCADKGLLGCEGLKTP